MTTQTPAPKVDKSRKRPKTGGRTKGTPNKATADVRMTIAAFAQGNADRFEQWILDTAAGDPEHGVKPDPAKAADLYLKAIEYHIPKLGRIEQTGEGGGPIVNRVEFAIVDAAG